MSAANLEVVQRLYQAFGEGNIPGVLDTLAADVDWFFPGPSSVVPFAGARRGKNEVRQFFNLAMQSIVIELFEAREFLDCDEAVVCLGHERIRSVATGKVMELDWAHVFEVAAGRIIRVREYYDTAAMVEGFTPAKS